MNSFMIGNTEFGIGDVSFSIKNDLLNLEITGREDVFDELMENDNCEWNWALYPPRIYFRGVPYKGNEIVVDEDLLNKYDIALYMMEHNDFTGTLEITGSNIKICGQVNIDGNALTLAVSVEQS